MCLRFLGLTTTDLTHPLGLGKALLSSTVATMAAATIKRPTLAFERDLYHITGNVLPASYSFLLKTDSGDLVVLNLTPEEVLQRTSYVQ